MPSAFPDRYHRQTLLAPIGKSGQDRLAASHVVIVGVGALGSASADLLARAGVGTLTIIDRDFVDPTNLQRQTLYNEDDVRENLPKAEAARRRLTAVNSQIKINAIVDDINPSNIQQHTRNADVIVDGLDNFETRYLLNDLAVRDGLAYIYGGAVSTHGMQATFLPHQSTDADRPTPWTAQQATPCLRCVFEEPPPPGTSQTCDTSGVLGSIVATIGAIQAVETIKVLVGDYASISRDLLTIDLWHNDIHRLDLTPSYRADECICCGKRRFDYLDGEFAGAIGTLCGRDMVQIVPASPTPTDLTQLGQRLSSVADVTTNAFFLRASLRSATDDEIEFTIFPNGRTLVKGVSTVNQARALHARYIGA